MASPIPASPQNSSSSATGMVRLVGSPSIAWAMKSKLVETDLGGFLDDRPRELLRARPIPQQRDAPDIRGEVVNPLLDLNLVFVEGQ